MKFCLLLLWVLVARSVSEAGVPAAAPPPVHGSRPIVPHPVRPSAVQQQYDIGDPTDEEQLFLEFVNRARTKPTAEGPRLAASTDANIREALQSYQVDLTKLQVDIATNPPVPPLAFEPRLMASARQHSQWMLDHAWQAHEETVREKS